MVDIAGEPLDFGLRVRSGSLDTIPEQVNELESLDLRIRFAPPFGAIGAVQLPGQLVGAPEIPPNVTGFTPSTITGQTGQLAFAVPINSGGQIATGSATARPHDAIKPPTLAEPNKGNPIPVPLPSVFVEGQVLWNPTDYPTWTRGNAVAEVFPDRWVNLLTRQQTRKDPFGAVLQGTRLLVRTIGTVGQTWSVQVTTPLGTGTANYVVKTGDLPRDVASGLAPLINGLGLGTTTSRQFNELTVTSSGETKLVLLNKAGTGDGLLKFGDRTKWLIAASYIANQQWNAQAQSGDIPVVVVNGDLYEYNWGVPLIGGGTASSQSGSRIHWTTTAQPTLSGTTGLPIDGSTPIPINLAIVGRNGRPTDIVQTLYLYEKVKPAGQPTVSYGIDRLELWDLVVENASFPTLADAGGTSGGTSQRAIGSGDQDETIGRIVRKRVTHTRSRLFPTGDGGYGIKWGNRSQICGRWHTEDCHWDDVEEHPDYIDNVNVSRNGKYTDDESKKSWWVRCDNVGNPTPDAFGHYNGGCGRTFFQLLVRPQEQINLGLTPKMSPGLMYFEDIHGWDCNLEGDESMFTFVPGPQATSDRLWDGCVIVRNSGLQEGARQVVAPHGSATKPSRLFLLWQDRNVNHGMRYTAEGFLTDRVILDGLWVKNFDGTKFGILPSARNSLVKVSGVKDLQIWGFDLGTDGDLTGGSSTIFALDSDCGFASFAGSPTSNNPPFDHDYGDGWGVRLKGSMCAMSGATRFFLTGAPSAYTGWHNGAGATGSAVANKVRVERLSSPLDDPYLPGAVQRGFTTLTNSDIDKMRNDGEAGLPPGWFVQPTGPFAGYVGGNVTQTWPDLDLDENDANKEFRLKKLPSVVSAGDVYLDGSLAVPTRNYIGVHFQNAAGEDFEAVGVDVENSGVANLAHVPVDIGIEMLGGTLSFNPPLTGFHTPIDTALELPQGTFSSATGGGGGGGAMTSVGVGMGTNPPNYFGEGRIWATNVAKGHYTYQYFVAPNGPSLPLTGPKGPAIVEPLNQFPDLNHPSYGVETGAPQGYYASAIIFLWQRQAYPPFAGDTADIWTVRWDGPVGSTTSSVPDVVDIVGSNVGALQSDRGPFHIKRRMGVGIATLSYVIKKPGVTNVRIYPPGFDEDAQGNPPPQVYPLYVSRTKEVVGPTDFYRIGGYTRPFDAGSPTEKPQTWAAFGATYPYWDQAKSSWTWGVDFARNRYGELRPVPDSWILDLWKQVDCNLWYNIPHPFLYTSGPPFTRTTTYLHPFMQAVKAALPPGRKVLFAVANEVWNAKEPRSDYITLYGDTWMEEYGKDCHMVYSVALQYFSRSELEVAIEGHIGDAVALPLPRGGPFLQRVCTSFAAQTPAIKIDTFAVSAYFRPGQTAIDFWRNRYDPNQDGIPDGPPPTVQEVLDAIALEIPKLGPALNALNTKLNNFTNNNASQGGVVPYLSFYEFGQSITPDAFWLEIARQAQNHAPGIYSPDMYDLYQMAYAQYEIGKVRHGCANNDFSDDLSTNGGGFGHRTSLWGDDDTLQARWRAIKGTTPNQVLEVLEWALDLPPGTLQVPNAFTHDPLDWALDFPAPTLTYNPPLVGAHTPIDLFIDLPRGTFAAATTFAPPALDWQLEIPPLGLELGFVPPTLGLSLDLLAGTFFVDGLFAPPTLGLGLDLLVGTMVPDSDLHPETCDMGLEMLAGTFADTAPFSFKPPPLDITIELIANALDGTESLFDPGMRIIPAGRVRMRVFTSTDAQEI